MRVTLLLAVMFVGLTLDAPAHAAVSFSNPTAIEVPAAATQGFSSPYPSTIVVQGLLGVVVDVNVTLHDVSHSCPDDLDILLVGPLGQRLVIQSDATGCSSINALTYTIDDDAAGPLADTGPPVPDLGRARPANYAGGPTDLAPIDDFALGGGPAAPYQHAAPTGTATLDGVFGNTTPNGSWRLYVFDDAQQDAGDISGGWSIEIETDPPSFGNGEPIVISETGSGVPYPSAIQVTGLGEIEALRVSLHGVTHSYPDDLAVLLEAPSGDALILQSGAGGTSDAANAIYHFDDLAAALSDTGPLATGGALVRPTSYDDPDFSVAGGPGPPYLAPFPNGVATLTSSFAGQPANGTWKLYVFDCCAPDAGIIERGWSLAITAPEPGTAASSLVAATALAAARMRHATRRRRVSVASAPIAVIASAASPGSGTVKKVGEE